MVICPEAIKAQNSVAAVSALGSAHWVFTRRLNSPCRQRGFDAPAAPIDTLLVAAGWGLEAALDDGCAGVARVETACLAEGALEVSPVVISDRQDDVDDLDPGIGQPAC